MSFCYKTFSGYYENIRWCTFFKLATISKEDRIASIIRFVSIGCKTERSNITIECFINTFIIQHG